MKQQNPTRQSWLDDEPHFSFVKGAIERGEFNATISRSLYREFGKHSSEASLRRFRRRHNLNIPGVEKGSTHIEGDTAECTTAPQGFVRHMEAAPILDDPDTMMRDRGLDPEQWYIDSIRVNEWDGPQADGNIVRYYQSKFTARRKQPELTLLPPRAEGWKKPKSTKLFVGKSQLVVICGDQQAPFQDPHLHELFCQWLRDHKPHRGINLGDLMDLPDLSRHPTDPENMALANECFQTGYDITRGYVDSSPSTEWEWIPGNHDLRLRDYLVKNAPSAYGLKRVDTPESRGEAIHRLEHLMRLDELGIRYVDPHGTYEDAQVELSPNLAVRHGWKVRQDAGVTALKTLETLGYSILVGHTHRQAIVHHTYHEIDGTPRQLLAAEIGCMCRLDRRGDRDKADRRYPNYATVSNWQRGFATATIYPDGKFRVDLGTYVNGVLMWRDRRYE